MTSVEPARHSIVLDAQVAALLQRVRDHGASKCGELQDQTQAQVRDILRDGRKQARKNVDQAVAGERSRIEQCQRRTQAALAAAERTRTAHRMQQLLETMWQKLPGALQSRWTDPQQRRSWWQAALRQALPLLSGRDWSIEHGADFIPGECETWLRQFVAGRSLTGPHSVAWRIDAEIPAGIRIRAGNACLDATIAGLLNDRAEIEALFLAEHGTLGDVISVPSVQ